MSGTVISLPHSKVHPSRERYWRCKSRREARSWPRSRISSSGWASVDAFERFMSWLGPDKEKAAQKYEAIRGRLIMMFKAQRCVFAEDLADATIERVTRKLSDLTFAFTGDPALYFYGVAKKIYLEYQRKLISDQRRSAYFPPTDLADPDLENMLKQLDDALSRISKSDRELILRYYSGSGKNKINHRRGLAEQLGVGSNTLRLRVFRIRKEIKNYIVRSSPDCRHPSCLSA